MIVGAVLVLLILAAAGAGYYYYNISTCLQEDVYVLVVGFSGDPGTGGSEPGGTAEAIAVVSVTPRKGRAAFVCIPEITAASDAERPMSLQDLYRHAGADALHRAVEDMLGVSITNHIYVDYDGFCSLIDFLGGVEVDVENEIAYRDKEGETIFSLQPGTQFLDGEAALRYVRFKGAGVAGSLDRIKRQSKLVSALLAHISHPANLPGLPAVVQQVNDMVETDLSLDLLLKTASYLRRREDNQIEVAVLPGELSDGLWHPLPREIEAMVAGRF